MRFWPSLLLISFHFSYFSEIKKKILTGKPGFLSGNFVKINNLKTRQLSWSHLHAQHVATNQSLTRAKKNQGYTPGYIIAHKKHKVFLKTQKLDVKSKKNDLIHFHKNKRSIVIRNHYWTIIFFFFLSRRNIKNIHIHNSNSVCIFSNIGFDSYTR